MVVEATGGNLGIAQALLRHKSQITTATFYKKAITPAGFKAGMAIFQKALTEGGK